MNTVSMLAADVDTDADAGCYCCPATGCHANSAERAPSIVFIQTTICIDFV